jgi:hypothetical protein
MCIFNCNLLPVLANYLLLIFEEISGILEPLKLCLSSATPDFIFCYDINWRFQDF